MKLTPILIVIGISVIAYTGLSSIRHSNMNNTVPVPGKIKPGTERDNIVEKLEQKARAARLFTTQHGYNSSTCFLIDMSRPSGQNRFFIYNLEKDSLQGAGLVAHGNCFENWLEGRRYSNVVGSGCTSLGKYRIGNAYIGKFGYSYKLYGLDSTNDRAYERTVVLHSYKDVPDTETPDDICQSNGCPMVSPAMLERLKILINHSRKPVLLWIYE